MKKTHRIATLLGAVALSLTAHAQEAADPVERAVHVCASCHGDEGRSDKVMAPSLAGQSRDYTIRQLSDFRNQSRAETDVQAYMWGISALLDDKTIAGLADYYAQQTPAAGRAAPARLAAVGRAIFERGIPAKGVRACASCHGDRAEGQAAFPRLAGQHADYLYRQLRAFRTPLRPHGILMKKETLALTDAQLRAVAAYLQSL
ncbi:MAG: c-type cytochrome [Burkholderiales bacterium]|nr:c-type cytochrome [Burkholderiales bacterium]